MKNILFYGVTFLFVSCYNSNRFIEIKQKECKECNIGISFYIKNNKIYDGSLSLKNTIVIKNPSLQYVDIDFYYFRNGEEINRDVKLMDFDKEYFFKNNGKRNRIRLSPLSEKEITYFSWNALDTINFNDNMYKGLKQYVPLAKSKIKNQDFLDYDQEPFSEFKRKNPELLEFLTKGDSIELEVISPVKQKYKFKAEW